MDYPKFESLWKLMTDYTFAIDSDSITENFECIICKKLMRDACHSTCGCQYCYSCVALYLKDGDKYCPGGNDECNEEYLVLERDVTRNKKLNNKILKLKVQCPNEFCQSKLELRVMEEHLQMCIKQITICPFVNIGCDDTEGPKDAVMSHINKNVFFHSQLLIEWIDNLRNEIVVLKENLAANKLDMAVLKEESLMKEARMLTLFDLLNARTREIEDIKAESKRNANRVNLLDQELRKFKNETNLKYISSAKEVKKYKISIDEQNKKVEAVIKDVNKVKEDIKQDNHKMLTMVNEIKDEMKETKIEKEEDITALMDKNVKEEPMFYRDEDGVKIDEAIHCYTNIEADFIWKICELSKKVETMSLNDILSQPFYCKDYKLCLRLWINMDNIGLYCVIMKGPNDDRLPWPMVHSIRLSILDQVTFSTYKSVVIRYDMYNDKKSFEKPKDDKNCRIGGPWPFINYSVIKRNASVIVGDSLVVSCSLGEPS